MRNLLWNGAMIFAGIVSVPAVVTTVDLRAASFKRDPRLPLLQRFFESKGAPAKAYSHLFLTEADLYDLDWRLLPSISFVETTGGKAARNNNMFGWDCGRAHFTSISEGIRRVAYYVGKGNRYKGKQVDEVLSIYNPDPEYPGKVKSVMSRIAPAE